MPNYNDKASSISSRHWRFSEAAFRKYETTLVRWYQNYPKPLIFEPPNSCETWTARIRDIARGYLEFRYPCQNIDYDTFKERWTKIQVSHNGYRVRIGPRAIANFDPFEDPSTHISQDKPSEVPVQNATPEVIISILNILNSTCVSCAFRLQNFDVNQLPQQLSQFPNVEFWQKGTDTILL